MEPRFVPIMGVQTEPTAEQVARSKEERDENLAIHKAERAEAVARDADISRKHTRATALLSAATLFMGSEWETPAVLTLAKKFADWIEG